MLSSLPVGVKIYLACGYTDMRKQIDGLAGLVQHQFELDPFGQSIFIFCGRKRDRIKVLLWEGDGFLLMYKRLEGGVFQWPRSLEDVRELSYQQYRWLLEGLKIEQKTALFQVEAKSRLAYHKHLFGWIPKTQNVLDMGYTSLCVMSIFLSLSFSLYFSSFL